MVTLKFLFLIVFTVLFSTLSRANCSHQKRLSYSPFLKTFPVFLFTNVTPFVSNVTEAPLLTTLRIENKFFVKSFAYSTFFNTIVFPFSPFALSVPSYSTFKSALLFALLIRPTSFNLVIFDKYCKRFTICSLAPLSAIIFTVLYSPVCLEESCVSADVFPTLIA